MPSSAASRWFVPDLEFFLATEDYAICAESAEYMQMALTESNKALALNAPFANYKDFLYSLNRGFYAFTFHRLVYADVDENNPMHKEMLSKRAKEPGLDTIPEKTIVVMKNFLEYLELEWSNGSEKEPTDSDTLEDLQDHIGRHLSRMKLNHDVVFRITNFIIKASTEDKGELMAIVSEQTDIKHRRPTMLLLGMIDNREASKIGETRGWAVGYDFFKDTLTIKPFVSKKGHHPLGEKWESPTAEDGISFTGSPGDFAKAVVTTGKAVESKAKVDVYKVLVYTHVAMWVGAHWDSLAGVSEAMHGDLLTESLRESLKDARTKMKSHLQATKFPRATEDGPQQITQVPQFSFMQRSLQCEESEFRATALDAKKDGNEKVAQNIAILYERLLEELRSFNTNVEKDF